MLRLRHVAQTTIPYSMPQALSHKQHLPHCNRFTCCCYYVPAHFTPTDCICAAAHKLPHSMPSSGSSFHSIPAHINMDATASAAAHPSNTNHTHSCHGHATTMSTCHAGTASPAAASAAAAATSLCNAPYFTISVQTRTQHSLTPCRCRAVAQSAPFHPPC
jgi:hypothetical protein